jgi:hypothetical protein
LVAREVVPLMFVRSMIERDLRISNNNRTLQAFRPGRHSGKMLSTGRPSIDLGADPILHGSGVGAAVAFGVGPRGLEINDQFDFRDLLGRQIDGFLAFENAGGGSGLL